MKKKHYILFENHKLIYGRVPKVANSSIKSALTRLLETPPLKKTKTTSDMYWKTGTNKETSMIGVREVLRLQKTHFTFAFVRNPFDRLVSAYHNKVIENRQMSGAMTKIGLTRLMEFPDFLEAVCRTPDEKMDPHLMPQSTMLVRKGRVVPVFIGRFERIDEDWAKLLSAMEAKNLKLPDELPRANVRRDASDNLRTMFHSEELIAKAATKYADDMKYFYAGLSIDQLLDRDIPGTWFEEQDKPSPLVEEPRAPWTLRGWLRSFRS